MITRAAVACLRPAVPFPTRARHPMPPPFSDLDSFEQMFEYTGMAVPATPTIDELRQRVQRMQGSAVSRSLPVLSALADLVSLRTGSVYAVDSPSLAMAVMAGPSRAGEWSAIIGAPDFGYEAAAA